MGSTKVWIYGAVYGAFVWVVGEYSGPVLAAALVGMTAVATSFQQETKLENLETQLKDLSWRLRHVMAND